MVGSGETYFAALVLALGASDEAGGLISSIPLLAGAILQLAAPGLARRVGSPRRWVSLCAVVQFLSFVPLIIAALLGSRSLIWLVFVGVSLYWAAALGAGPTWSSWVATTFPSNVRARYFSLRNRLCQLVQLAGIVLAGLALRGFEAARESSAAAAAGVAVTASGAAPTAPASGEIADTAAAAATTALAATPALTATPSLTATPALTATGELASTTTGAAAPMLIGFAIILAAAGLSRLASTLFLRTQADAPHVVREHERVSVWSLLRRLAKGRDLRLIHYLIVAQFTVQLSAPFFNPYMLRSLALDKSEYLLMVATLFASKSLFLPLHGRFARRFGARRLLMVAGVGVVGLSAAWVLSPSLYYLVPLQALNGCVWGAWELATFLLMLEMIPDRERTGVLTVFNLLNCTAMVVGSLTGAFLLRAMDSTRDAYLTLFVVSSLLRLASLPALWALGRERRPPSKALTVAAEEAAGRSAPGSQGRAALPSFTGPGRGARSGGSP